MLSPLENYFARQTEPLKSCLGFLRGYILHFDERITEAWRYGMPFYLFNGKRFCYLWINKSGNIPYIGFTDGYKMTHPALVSEKRARMKIWLADSSGDIDTETLDALLKQAVGLVTP